MTDTRGVDVRLDRRKVYRDAVEADATLSGKSTAAKELATTIMEKYDRD